MTNENTYQKALSTLRAGRIGEATSTLRDLLESADTNELRAYVLVALAEVEVLHNGNPSSAARHLATLSDLLNENGNLPSIHRANYATLQAQVHIKANEPAQACPLLKDAIGVYEAHGDGPKALNASLLLSASLLASGDAAGALAVCKEIRLSANCTARIFELNALQAKVAQALGDDAMQSRLIGRVVEGLKSRLGDADFRALVEVLAIDGDAFNKYPPATTYADAVPFPVSASVLGQKVE